MTKFYAIFFFLFLSSILSHSRQLSPTFYGMSCRDFPSISREVLNDALQRDLHVGSQLLALHAHDCLFYGGCHGKILLDQSVLNYCAKAVEVIDEIKQRVDNVCGSIVSMPDIMAIAARDYVVASGGPTWEVPLGRRQFAIARCASYQHLLSPRSSINQLIEAFANLDLNKRDLVALLGGHSLGYVHCGFLMDRIYNDSNIDPIFKQELKYDCPINGNDSSRVPFDSTYDVFDGDYFQRLNQQKGVLHSDQELSRDNYTASLVKKFAHDNAAFFVCFVNAVIKLGRIAGNHGLECKA